MYVVQHLMTVIQGGELSIYQDWGKKLQHVKTDGYLKDMQNFRYSFLENTACVRSKYQLFNAV